LALEVQPDSFGLVVRTESLATDLAASVVSASVVEDARRVKSAELLESGFDQLGFRINDHGDVEAPPEFLPEGFTGQTLPLEP
jgi:hypothetical protein